MSNQSNAFNFARKLFHASGLIVPVIYYIDFAAKFDLNWFQESSRSILFYWIGTFSVFLLFFEFMRMRSAPWQKFFMMMVGPLLKGREAQNIHGSVPFMISLTIVIGIFSKEVAILSVLYLTLCDPVAAFVGSRYGTIRFKNGKSVEGTVAGIMAATVTGLLFLAVNNQLMSDSSFVLIADEQLYWPAILAVVFGAITAFLVELVSRDGLFDDNWTIPVGSATVMSICHALLTEAPIEEILYPISSLLIPL